MKRLVWVIDGVAFFVLGSICAALAALSYLAAGIYAKRKRGSAPMQVLSFAICDLIANKCPSMMEDALLNGYISKHHYLYLDYNNRNDRFMDIDNKIFFHSIAAHPDNAIYESGFRKTSMLFTEIRLMAKAVSIAGRNNIAMVKAHDPHLLGMNGLLIARWFRIPSVLHMNSDFGMKYRGTGRTASAVFLSRGTERMFESLIIDSYDLVTADRKFYATSPGFPRRSLKRYRPFGVRVDSIHYSEPNTRKDLKTSLGLSGKRVVIYVGRLHPVKYPEDAIRAFAIIKKRVSNAAIVIAGSGILIEDLKALAMREGVEDSVLFVGPVKHEQITDLFHTADLLLAPHGGVTLVEAALASKPIVAYDFDWHAEFLENGKMGYLTPFRDYRDMAEKAVKILLDDALRRDMGAYGRKVAFSEYSRERSIESEKAAYDSLVRP